MNHFRQTDIIAPQFEALRPFLHDLPARFDSSGRLIYNERNKVRLIDAPDGTPLAVKRFKRPNIVQRLDYTFRRPSKARRAFDFGVRLVELGIDTPQPVACIETYEYGLFTQGYFVSLVNNDPDARILREHYADHMPLLQAVAAFIATMHERGFLHGDPNLSNFIYHADAADPTGYHVATIDINRSHFVVHPSRRQCLDGLFRITHVRPVLRLIVEHYARLRGWDPTECADYVERRLTQFERRKGRRPINN